MQQRLSKQQWQDLITEQEQSSLSAAAFCRSKDIAPKNFYNNRDKSRQALLKSSAFVRAQVAKPDRSASTITLSRGDCQLYFPTNVSPSWLADLVKSLS